MITLDFSGQGALITGGTRGFGKAMALELARTGLTVFVTHRWGSADEDALVAEFKAEGLTPPVIRECDASDGAAIRELLGEIKTKVGSLRVIASNVSFSKVVNALSDLKKGSLDLSIGYSAWPVVDLAQASREVLGAYPRYLLGVSSDGAEFCHEGYDIAGASKAVLETLCRYLAVRLKPEGVRVNVLRPGALDTDSARMTFGEAAMDKVRHELGEVFLDPRRVAQSAVALCSGLLDSVTGQVIAVDEGWSLVSPLSYVTGRKTPFNFPAEEKKR